MKQFPLHLRSSKQAGFTLVELLVVIGIIAILAGVLLTAGGTALNAARRAKAANLANQLQTASLAYYTEYSIYPVPSGTPASTDLLITDATASKAAWAGFLYGLCGNINPHDGTTTAPSNPVPNTRAISFLNLKSSDVDANNAPLNPIGPNTTTNPYFNICIDNDYDGILGGTSTSTGDLPNFTTAVPGTAPPMTGTSTAGVAVWANCNPGPNSQNPSWWVHTY